MFWPFKGGVDSDHYAHCYFSCRISQECGSMTAEAIGWVKEIFDAAWPNPADESDIIGDMTANYDGLACAGNKINHGQTNHCHCCCSQKGYKRGKMWLP